MRASQAETGAAETGAGIVEELMVGSMVELMAEGAVVGLVAVTVADVVEELMAGPMAVGLAEEGLVDLSVVVVAKAVSTNASRG